LLSLHPADLDSTLETLQVEKVVGMAWEEQRLGSAHPVLELPKGVEYSLFLVQSEKLD
jgi:hypothetical protein